MSGGFENQVAVVQMDFRCSPCLALVESFGIGIGRIGDRVRGGGRVCKCFGRLGIDDERFGGRRATGASCFAEIGGAAKTPLIRTADLAKV